MHNQLFSARRNNKNTQSISRGTPEIHSSTDKNRKHCYCIRLKKTKSVKELLVNKTANSCILQKSGLYRGAAGRRALVKESHKKFEVHSKSHGVHSMKSEKGSLIRYACF